MINPNSITNVSFASSPALQAILNANVTKPVNAVNSTTPISTDSYIVQQQAQNINNPIKNVVPIQEAVLEHTPKTDVYEPMHKKNDSYEGKNQKSAAKTAGKVAFGIATVLAAVIFAPKVAKALLGNVDATKPFITKGKEALNAENLKVGLKKITNFIAAQEEKITNSKAGEFAKAQVSNVVSAFKKDGAVGKQAEKITSAFKKDGVVGKQAEKLLSSLKKTNPSV